MLTMDWATKIVTVPISYLTLVQTLPVPIYNLPLNQFRLDLKGLEASEDGMPFLNTHNHNTEVLLGGIVYARIIEMINGYTVTFEDGQYAVNLVGANSNVGDVVNVNQVSVRSQNSAGLISNDAIEYSSFNGGVWIDESNHTGIAVSGTVFPAGTPQAPCLFASDAALIASRRGFDKAYILGNITLTSAQTWTDFTFEGESANKTTITVEASANVFNCEFYEATITGTLDGNSQIERCVVNNLDFVDGYIFNCAIGDIILGLSTIANIFQSFSTVPGTNTPVIDMNGSGILALRDYNGGVMLINYSGNDSHSIDLSSGQVKLDSNSILGGTFVVRGVGKLIDELGNPIPSGTWNGGVTIVNELVNLNSISTETATAIWNALGADHLTPNTMGAYLQDTLKYVGLNVTSAEVLGETHLTLWTDETLTTIWKVINIGTVDIPKRLDVP